MVLLKEVLSRNKEQIYLEPDKKYKQVKVKLWNKGVLKRNEVFGYEIKSDKRFVVKSGQFILSKIDARHAAFGLVPKELDGAVTSSDFLSYNINTKKIIPRFFEFVVKMPIFIEECKNASVGTTNRRRLKEDFFLSIDFPIPSLEKQQQLLKKFNSLSDYINLLKGIESLNLDYAINLRKGLFDQIILKKNDIEKRDWKEVEIGELADFRRGPFGSSIKKSVCVPKGKETYKLYEQGNVINKNFERGKYYLNREKFNQLKNFEIFPEDILITCAGTIGKIAIVPKGVEKGIINSALMRIRINKKKISPKFFIYLFKGSLIQNNISSGSEGMAMKNLFATKILKKIKVSLPPLAEQLRIVEKVDALMKSCDELELRIKENKKGSERLMGAVLREAFSK